MGSCCCCMGCIPLRSNRVRFLVKDLSNGKTFVLSVNDPSSYRLVTLHGEIEKKSKSNNFILKYNKNILPVKTSPDKPLSEALCLSENGTSEQLGLVLEYLDDASQAHSNQWTLHVKTLAGRIIDVETSNPQELCVLGLKLLIHEESGMKPERIRLVMDNKELEDGRPDAPSLVKDIPGITNGSTIQLVLKNK